MSYEQKLYELGQVLELARDKVARLRKAGTDEARAERERERWVARAELAETREALLRAALEGFAEGDCEYGDGCPPCSGTWHGQCNPCRAREALTQAAETLKPKSVAAAAPMRMRAALPSEPGWYWAQLRDIVWLEGGGRPAVVQVVRRNDGKLVAHRPHYRDDWPLDVFVEWSDRIPEPEVNR